MKIEEKVEKCRFSRFCESFGEWKCVKLERRIDIEADCVGCKLYKKGTKKPDEVCHCEVCLVRDAMSEACTNVMDKLNEISRAIREKTERLRDSEK